MRKLRKKQDDEEFLSKIKRGVNRRVFIENKLEKRNNNFHVSFDIVLLWFFLKSEQIKKLINTTVTNFYKPPVKFKREDQAASDEGDIPSKSIRDIVSGDPSQKSKMKSANSPSATGGLN